MCDSIVSVLPFTVVDILLNATFKDCFWSSKYILVPLILVVPLLTSVTTLSISSLLPAMFALSATLESTIKPSAIALLDCIPFWFINWPVPFSSYNANVKLPVASFPICILTLPFLSLNCCKFPCSNIEPSLLWMLTLLVLIVPVLILLALTLSIIAFLIKPSSTVNLSPVITIDWILSLVKLPFTNVVISAKSPVNVLILALVVFKSDTLALVACKLVILALVAFKSDISALSIRALFILAVSVCKLVTLALVASNCLIVA